MAVTFGGKNLTIMFEILRILSCLNEMEHCRVTQSPLWEDHSFSRIAKLKKRVG